MYQVKKVLTISASHQLDLPYESPCKNLHGHNWRITVCLRSKTLNSYGMILDFKHIKDQIEHALDHRNLNDVLSCNPTAENIAKWVCDHFDCCYRVDVEESENNTATYIKDED